MRGPAACWALCLLLAAAPLAMAARSTGTDSDEQGTTVLGSIAAKYASVKSAVLGAKASEAASRSLLAGACADWELPGELPTDCCIATGTCKSSGCPDVTNQVLANGANCPKSAEMVVEDGLNWCYKDTGKVEGWACDWKVSNCPSTATGSRKCFGKVICKPGGCGQANIEGQFCLEDGTGPGSPNNKRCDAGKNSAPSHNLAVYKDWVESTSTGTSVAGTSLLADTPIVVKGGFGNKDGDVKMECSITVKYKEAGSSSWTTQGTWLPTSQTDGMWSVVPIQGGKSGTIDTESSATYAYLTSEAGDYMVTQSCTWQYEEVRYDTTVWVQGKPLSDVTVTYTVTSPSDPPPRDGSLTSNAFLACKAAAESINTITEADTAYTQAQTNNPRWQATKDDSLFAEFGYAVFAGDENLAMVCGDELEELRADYDLTSRRTTATAATSTVPTFVNPALFSAAFSYASSTTESNLKCTAVLFDTANNVDVKLSESYPIVVKVFDKPMASVSGLSGDYYTGDTLPTPTISLAEGTDPVITEILGSCNAPTTSGTPSSSASVKASSSCSLTYDFNQDVLDSTDVDGYQGLTCSTLAALTGSASANVHALPELTPSFRDGDGATIPDNTVDEGATGVRACIHVEQTWDKEVTDLLIKVTSDSDAALTAVASDDSVYTGLTRCPVGTATSSDWGNCYVCFALPDSYTENGLSTVTIEATGNASDEDTSALTSEEATLTVINVCFEDRPISVSYSTVTATEAKADTEGIFEAADGLTITIAFQDPGVGDTHTFTWKAFRQTYQSCGFSAVEEMGGSDTELTADERPAVITLDQAGIWKVVATLAENGEDGCAKSWEWEVHIFNSTLRWKTTSFQYTLPASATSGSPVLPACPSFKFGVPKSGVQLRLQCQNNKDNKFDFYTNAVPTWKVFPLGPARVFNTDKIRSLTDSTSLKNTLRYRIIGDTQGAAKIGVNGKPTGYSDATWYLHAVENGDRFYDRMYLTISSAGLNFENNFQHPFGEALTDRYTELKGGKLSAKYQDTRFAYETTLATRCRMDRTILPVAPGAVNGNGAGVFVENNGQQMNIERLEPPCAENICPDGSSSCQC
mmetsp:Transcript_16270/g.40482  ORF Transcript_16270/g.40482 Transcript_16270/m.40482 type:complete len:1094 (-) Transcript_16270:1760-5041(-)|eukprot:CAMPEP_0202860320 /NCGR_PEP_ID=MMETSP1391-20130828/2073_1 /ASSEMBLY_ACC=CAM_ASM_000867 /TAXON_ID=1034604 /ORGANISM="Chlamydomonas leiostraca, Strain SAG 11-49" /LENGTH=1093 /DNA_ID=CAMNT_0049539475 /DNA_START=99 /DNA_END=3380 /DNA_ORIENTATION=+